MNNILEPCLNWSILGMCESFFNKEYSFYNLGVAITVIGILFAGYQLLNNEFKFRIRFRTKLWRFFLYGFVIGGNFFSVVIATILPVLPGLKGRAVFGYSPFWEFLGATCFIVGILGISLVTTRPIKQIDISDLNKLEDIVVGHLAKGTKGAEILCEEMKYFFGDYFKHLTKGDIVAQRLAILFSDAFLLHAISENPGTLNAIVGAYINNTEEYEDGEMRIERMGTVKDWSFLKNLFHELLNNNQSLIARELHEKSFSLINERKGIFCYRFLDNPDLLTDYDLLGGYEYSPVGRNIENFRQNYLLFWEKAMDELFSNKVLVGGKAFAKSIESVFSTINGIAHSKTSIGEMGRCFHWIIRFRQLIQDSEERLLKIFPSENIPQLVMETGKHILHPYSTHKNHTFIDVIAFGFDGFLETVAQKIQTDETRDQWETRHLCMEIFDNHMTEKGGKILQALEIRLNQIFIQRIDHNLLGWYPMVLPLFFHAFGYQIFDEYRKNGVIDTPIYKEILEKMSEKLPRITQGYIRGDQEIVTEYSKKKSVQILEDILPKNMEYLKESNTLLYYYFDHESSASIPLGNFILTPEIKM